MKLIKEDIGELDSAGNSLSNEQVDFFKNSKVRNKQGKLIVCYHGTDVEFDMFNKDRVRPGTFGNGFYFTTSKRSGARYGEHVGEYYLNANKILTIPVDYEDITEFVEKEYGVIVNSNKEATDVIISKGYDAITTPMYYKDDEFDYFVVFEPSQIKAITNKKPTNKDSINESTDVFYVGDTEVIQNPSDTEYRQFYSEIKKGLGVRYDYRIHEPLVRYTYDDKGNYYIWNAFKSTHYGIEKEIKQRYNVRVHQGKLFDIDEED